MIQLSSVTKAFGNQVLLERVSWQISVGERVGLCGPNGAGKTTLLRMLVGFEQPDEGRIILSNDLKVGYLPQDGLAHSGCTLNEEVSKAFQPLLDIQGEMHLLEEQLGDKSVSTDAYNERLSRYSDLQEIFRRREGYMIDLKIATVLRGLGFTDSEFTHQTHTFSGGWQMRIALAKLLLSRPGLLLLDEPTNHLDLEARNWLEDYLNGYPHAVILVSHDRFFLDAVVTRIVDVGARTLTNYTGNYSSYLTERDAHLNRLRERKRRQDEEIARIRQFVDRFRYQATKAAQVQSRLKMLDKFVLIDVPPERKRVHFTFPTCRQSGRQVLELQDVQKSYGENVVVRKAALFVERGNRIAIVGPNGAGKSTLMRILAGVESPDAGQRYQGHNVITEYFAQDEADQLDGSQTVHETLAAGAPLEAVPTIRNLLGGFLFSGDDIHKQVGVLSGGERTRLAVARMLLRPANTLLLDEPTNHLDIDSTDVLLEALAAFKGTLIFVSHDRYFVDRLATQIIKVGTGDVLIYPGSYEEFRWSQHENQQPRDQIAKGGSRKSEQVGAGKKHKQAIAKKRKAQRTVETQQKQIADLERQISELEKTLKQLELRMAEPGFYDDPKASQPTINHHQTLMWQVGDLMHQWEELQLKAGVEPAGES
ncbi:MAG TPA: ABC transporter ATP-binding protein [Acidobacteria bacterium]|jgi:ATP-binding cassette subfamily F protein 3|nr:ABC transporter ATP-binding protein [Acidobacteriota bacterium]|tara:strand:+ start:909 stop:2858 length:1950 start_codon:yes stop_codon:yes gene_type:complete